MLGFVILLWISFSLLILLFRTRRPTNFPPGPGPIPIFGNLLQLNLESLPSDLTKLSERYGKVYSIYLGSKSAVVLNGLQAMREALVTQSVEFVGRPKDLMVNHLTEDTGIIMTDGSMWKEHRRFTLTTLRNFGMGKHTMEERILGEISYIASQLEKNAGKPTDPQTLLHKATFNVICMVLFGTRFKHEDEFLQLTIRNLRESSRIINGPWSMKVFENRIILKKPLGDQVSQHKEYRVPGEPRDLIDCYLDEMEKRGDDGSSFSEYQLVSYLLDILFAGTETSANTLLSAFLYITTHPDVQGELLVAFLWLPLHETELLTAATAFMVENSLSQLNDVCHFSLWSPERCQKEIDEVLGEKEQATFEDRHRMPYTQAMIHEIQRVADTAPLAVFHATTKDTRLMGYDIPKGTIIIPNLSSVLNEESQWKFPHDFNPSNFLNDQGEFVKPEASMPFSAGPRLCPGEGLARMELFLILVTLLRRFKFVWPEDAGVPDYTPIFGANHTPKPYRMGVKVRGSSNQ
ncbi:cytochrome P450 2F2-like isoform X2 [Conger conger]|uniref:cytochrome P450 2F2-like isoform X2 n=1 Tax=Conger conger TaxID=82655 RepID=UPI002A5ABAE8|nr:cytochrome P450 2F2-like isoform X2 [Conger conger]